MNNTPRQSTTDYTTLAWLPEDAHGISGRESEEFDEPAHGRVLDAQSRQRSQTWSEDGPGGDVYGPGGEVDF